MKYFLKVKLGTLVWTNLSSVLFRLRNMAFVCYEEVKNLLQTYFNDSNIRVILLVDIYKILK